MDYRKEFLVKPGSKVKLADIDPDYKGKHVSDDLIPSNHKWFRNLAISQIVADSMEELGMKMPEPRVDLKVIRTEYHEAADQESQRKNNKSRKKRRKDKQKAE